MNRMERLIAIMTVLQSKKHVTAEYISERFDISVRTVYRDIKALGESGIPVGFEAPKGYFITQGYFLPPVSFTTEEANALVLLESVAMGFTDKSIKKHYSAALNKVKASLRSTQKDHAEALTDTIRMQLPERMMPDYEYMSTIQQHIAGKTIIEIAYKNSKDEVSDRQVEPIGLIFYAFSWHMIAWCHLRQEYRDFKISRLIRLKGLDQPFAITTHISLAEYMPQLPVAF
ncbi:MAG: YafY family transcriptional regulator [Bacteroidetes bacterium]|nr:YafY family transcriptional regulator [Bacteroidota bacterium]